MIVRASPDTSAARYKAHLARSVGRMGWLQAWGVGSWAWVFCVELGYLCGRFVGTHEVVSEVFQ